MFNISSAIANIYIYIYIHMTSPSGINQLWIISKLIIFFFFCNYMYHDKNNRKS